LKRKAQRLPFTVRGRNSQEAIWRAIKEYDVPERERFRVNPTRGVCNISFGFSRRSVPRVWLVH
jgi:hypothetical protein